MDKNLIGIIIVGLSLGAMNTIFIMFYQLNRHFKYGRKLAEFDEMLKNTIATIAIWILFVYMINYAIKANGNKITSGISTHGNPYPILRE